MGDGLRDFGKLIDSREAHTLSRSRAQGEKTVPKRRHSSGPDDGGPCSGEQQKEGWGVMNRYERYLRGQFVELLARRENRGGVLDAGITVEQWGLSLYRASRRRIFR